MGLLDKIKEDAKKSGQSKGKFIYFREGEKRRIRFLSDMEDGMEIVFHDSFQANINVPCQEIFGRSCQYCDEEGLRTRSQYLWCVWDYDASEVKLFMFPMNNCSPLGNIAAMYETYGTLLDRDYVISVSGKQKDKTYSVVPMDKNKFRNEKAKPYSKTKILEMLDKAYPDEHSEYRRDDKEDDGDDKELPWKTPGEDDDKSEYDDKSPKELYKMCKERELEVEPKKPAAYYINLLKEDDKAHEDWDDDSDEWAEDDSEEEWD